MTDQTSQSVTHINYSYYSKIFSYQAESLCNKGDLLMIIAIISWGVYSAFLNSFMGLRVGKVLQKGSALQFFVVFPWFFLDFTRFW